MFDASLIDVV